MASFASRHVQELALSFAHQLAGDEHLAAHAAVGEGGPLAGARVADPGDPGSDGADEGALEEESDSSAERKRKRVRAKPAQRSSGALGAREALSCRNQTGYIGVRQRKWGMYAAEIRDGSKRR
jgi:hypothetical protein